MHTSIIKWGNSQGVRLPKAFLKSIDLAENDAVDVTLKGEEIVIKKAGKKRFRTLKEILVDFYGENYRDVVEPQEEYDWGKPKGKEVW